MAQGLMILALPVLTRLYVPEDFGLLAIYTSLLGILVAVAGLRLEIAIPLPDGDEDAANLLALALVLSATYSSVLGVVLFLFGDELVSLIGQVAFKPYLWIVPVGVWLASSYQALQYWASRKKRFKMVARTRVTQALSGISVQLGFGIFGSGPLGLLLGQTFSASAGNYGLARSALIQDRQSFEKITWKRMWKVFRSYDRFAKFSTLEAFANNAGVQIPILIIASLAGGPEVGYLMLAIRVIGAPMGLIGSAISQVYLAHAASKHRINQLGASTLDTLGGLAKVGVGPLLFAGIVAPAVFPLVFGPEWQRAGVLVSWLTPSYVLQFLASPVSMSLHVTGRQRTAMMLQISGFVLRSGGVLVAALIVPARIVETYALTGVIFYFIYLLIVSHVVGIRMHEVLRVLYRAKFIMFSWIIAAISCCTLFVTLT